MVPFTGALLASLVQYYNAMIADKLSVYNCPVLHKLLHAVMEVEAVDGASASALLRTWSTEVQSNFTAKNAVAIGCANSSDDIKEFLKMSSSCTTELLKQINMLTLEVANLKNQLTTVSDNLMGVAVKVDEVTSPQKRAPQKPRMMEPKDDDSDDDSDETDESDDKDTSTKKRKLSVSKFDITFTPGKASSSGDKRAYSSWPTIPYFLEDLANQGDLKGMGDKTYQFASEHVNVKRTMKHVKDHITKEEMMVLKSKGVGNTSGEKATSLKNTCNNIYTKARDDIMDKLGVQETKKSKGTGPWSHLKMGNKIKDIEKATKLKKDATDQEQRKKRDS